MYMEDLLAISQIKANGFFSIHLVDLTAGGLVDCSFSEKPEQMTTET